MSTRRTGRHADDESARAVSGWGVAVRLGLVLSVAAALVSAALAERVPAATLICIVIAVGSVAGWRSAERAPTPAPIRLRRR